MENQETDSFMELLYMAMHFNSLKMIYLTSCISLIDMSFEENSYSFYLIACKNKCFKVKFCKIEYNA